MDAHGRATKGPSPDPSPAPARTHTHTRTRTHTRVRAGDEKTQEAADRHQARKDYCVLFFEEGRRKSAFSFDLFTAADTTASRLNDSAEEMTTSPSFQMASEWQLYVCADTER